MKLEFEVKIKSDKNYNIYQIYDKLNSISRVHSIFPKSSDSSDKVNQFIVVFTQLYKNIEQIANDLHVQLKTITETELINIRRLPKE